MARGLLLLPCLINRAIVPRIYSGMINRLLDSRVRLTHVAWGTYEITATRHA